MTDILILGAGFGGISAALKLEKKLGGDSDFKITLLDRNSFHLFTPSLYEAATVYGLIEDNFNRYLRGSVAIPIGEIIKDKKINFIQAEIKEINLKEKSVSTNGGAKLNFDYLIIALGGETEFYNIPGVREYAFNFKTVDDAIGIFKKVKEIYESYQKPSHEEAAFFAEAATKAESEDDGKIIKIAVIGGGFTGVELAAELACCIKNIVKAGRLDKKCTQIQLFEAGPAILPAVNEKQRKIIKKRLKKLGVEIQENSQAEEIGTDYIKIKDRGEPIKFDLTVWAGGVRGHRLLENRELKLTQKGTAEVNEFLQTKNSDDSINEKTFAIGDSISFIDPKTQKPVPATAYVAHGLADVAAGNIIRSIKNQPLKPYKPFYDVWVAPAGGKWAYFHFRNIDVKGFWGYLLRQLVDLRYFLRILPLEKALSLFFKDLVIFTKND